VRAVNQHAVNPRGQFVLYWMIAFRRPRHNFALDRAAAWARELRLPLVVLESLRVDYPHASERLHRFVLDGMDDNRRAFAGTPVQYYAYVEPSPGAAKGMLATLGSAAALVVTDDYPCFFLPAAVASAGAQLPVRLEAVDSNGLIPLSAVPQAYPAAVHFRRFMQATLRDHLRDVPVAAPTFGDLSSMPAGVLNKLAASWPMVSADWLQKGSAVSALPIDHRVGPVGFVGGHRAAADGLASFVRARVEVYGEHHSHPDDRGTSRLSPYLHFGHISSHEIFSAVMSEEAWSLGRLGPKPTGARAGWWGVRPGAEAFLDQLITWRELGFNTCVKRPGDYNRFEGLPEWARQTLERHVTDRRVYAYTFEQFERGETHDPLWNAAQREMLRDGWMHNYLRMLWGKKILEWSAHPREALDTMMGLMDKWCIDGRDPNSYAGYGWTLGRYDRPWPERPIFGTVRSMSSENTARKVRVARYLAEGAQLNLL
jgi:deoxyribodipyrimidine photo-lyase